MGWTGWPTVSKEIFSIIIHKRFFCNMKWWNMYSISYKKKLKRSTHSFSLNSTNSFTIYSYERSLNVLFRFSLKFASERKVFWLIFQLFHQQTAFFYLLWDQIWSLSGPVRKHHFSFFKFSFSLKVFSQMVEILPNYGHTCMESILKN